MPAAIPEVTEARVGATLFSPPIDTYQTPRLLVYCKIKVLFFPSESTHEHVTIQRQHKCGCRYVLQSPKGTHTEWALSFLP